jgi:hypothetical protein
VKIIPDGGIIPDDRAVSETIGYIIIFGIVIAGIGMVFMIGGQILSDTQESASFQGLEQSFEVISSDLKRTAFEESPIMTTRVKIDYGTLALLPGGASDCEILVKDAGSNSYHMPLGVLKFISDSYGNNISIENGALVKTYNGDGSFASIMSSEPRIFYSMPTRTLMISVVNLKGEPSSYGGGIDTIRLRYMDSSMPAFADVAGPVTICIRTNNTNAWNNYFSNGLKDTTKYIDPASVGWTNVTIDDADPGWDIKKLVVVTYNVSVEL